MTSSADSYKTQLEDKNKEIAQLTEENSRISQENGYLLRSKQKVEGRLNSQVKETEQQLTERNKIKVTIGLSNNQSEIWSGAFVRCEPFDFMYNLSKKVATHNVKATIHTGQLYSLQQL